MSDKRSLTERINEDGKIIWPIEDETEMSAIDAFATLWDISECRLTLSFWVDGNEQGDELALDLSGMALYPDAPSSYFRIPFKDALKTLLEDFDLPEHRQMLIETLLHVYCEYEKACDDARTERIHESSPGSRIPDE